MKCDGGPWPSQPETDCPRPAVCECRCNRCDREAPVGRFHHCGNAACALAVDAKHERVFEKSTVWYYTGAP
jgi:hypothetical protein